MLWPTFLSDFAIYYAPSCYLTMAIIAHSLHPTLCSYDSVSNMDETFARVLVVGPTKSGKTSLLASLSHSQSQEYEPTIVATKFTDCARKLTFIDTPGIDDTVLHQGMRPDYSLRYESFENDSLVKELRGIPNSAAMNANTANNTNSQPVFNIFKEPALAALVESNLVNIHAVLIVYTGDSFSLRTVSKMHLLSDQTIPQCFHHSCFTYPLNFALLCP